MERNLRRARVVNHLATKWQEEKQKKRGFFWKANLGFLYGVKLERSRLVAYPIARLCIDFKLSAGSFLPEGMR